MIVYKKKINDQIVTFLDTGDKNYVQMGYSWYELPECIEVGYEKSDALNKIVRIELILGGVEEIEKESVH